MTESITTYLAGPIQHAADHGKGWRNRLKQNPPEMGRTPIEFKDPMDKYNAHDDETREWGDEEIVTDDLVIIDSCDALLVHWLEVPTCGTPMEMRYAYDRGYPIVVQTTVPSEELSPWLTYHADYLVETFTDAFRALDHELGYGDLPAPETLDNDFVYYG